MKNNAPQSKFHGIYVAGFLLILALPILTIPPYFFPADWGKTIVFRSVLAILVFLFIFQILYKKTQGTLPDIRRNKLVWLLAILFFVFLLATVFSQDRYFSLWGDPERSGGFINFTFYIAFALLAFFVAKKSDWQRMWGISIGVGALVSLVAIIQFYSLLSSIFLPVPDRPPSTLGNSIFLGMYLVMLFFITLALAIKEKKVGYKVAYFSCLALFFCVILISGSRAAYLGLLAGGVYFLLMYPKKLPALKITAVVALAMVIGIVYYANTSSYVPTLLQKNKFFGAVQSRLSIQSFLHDSRFYAWQIAFSALKEKPLLGFGPENFSIGFDRHYDPSLPYIGQEASNWWDRAHSIFFDTGVTTGILGILAYFSLFIYLFWKLRKTKASQTEGSAAQTPNIIIHGLQATLIAYLVANLFSFDSFATYLLFFLIIGYALCMIYPDGGEPLHDRQAFHGTSIIYKWKLSIIGVLFIILVIFLWQYNIAPFGVNAKINTASQAINVNQCAASVATMESIMSQHTFLDSYARMKYVSVMTACITINPENNAAYAARGAEIMKEAVALQPLYPRLWIFLGAFTTVKASLEKDPTAKLALLQEANSYLTRAGQLAPNHEELFIEKIKLDMVSQDYQKMRDESEQCIGIYQEAKECYWFLGISQIYLNNLPEAQKYMGIAQSKNFDQGSISALNQLVSAYSATGNYQALAQTYIKLIAANSKIAQYHASLAFTYSKLGEYKKARQEALIFLTMMPEAKDEVNAFLKTLPQ